MDSTLAYTAGAPPRDAALRPSLVNIGMAVGCGLLVLPALFVATVRLTEPGDPIIARLLAVETVLIAASQVAISVVVVLRRLTPGVGRALIPALVAGLVVAAGDLAGMQFAFATAPAVRDILSLVAYDVVLGVVLALPIVIVLQAASRCRIAAEKDEVDASPQALISAYRSVLQASARRGSSWRVYPLLGHQLLRRHVRRTLEAVQRGYATRAVERGLDEAEARERQKIDDYLLSIPPISTAVPIPTIATIFVPLVPLLVAVAAKFAPWFSSGRWGLADVSEPIDIVVPHEVTTLVTDALALVIAFFLLMLVLAPAIHRRDRLLAQHMVCEREVILMDDRLGVPRSSRRLEYVMAALPAMPLALYGGTVLAYALAGLFSYPSPEGPLGSLVDRAGLMHLGPVTGAVLAQAFLVAAAAWIAWIVKIRKTTRVVFL